MELDQEKQNQEAAERCRALAQRIVRELAPRSVQVLEDSGLLEKAFCKMNTAVVQSAPELLVVADPQWVSLPAVQAEKVLLVCAEYAGMADCAKQLAAQGFCRELAWKDHGKEQLTALFCRMDAPELPELENGMEIKVKSLEGNQHFTQAPPRYTEATLIKALEENGIGRPSTYAPTITTITTHLYVEREGKQLKPTVLGEVTTELMKEHFPNILDVKFTADMENSLDDVERGKKSWVDTLEDFYGDFSKTLETAEEKMEGKRVKVPDEETDIVCDQCGRNMVIKIGRYGRFLACPGFPECKNTKKIVQETAGSCPLCGNKIILKKSKRGRSFYGCNAYPDCNFMTWNVPTEEKCPQCGCTLFQKGGKSGTLVCEKPGCGYSRPVGGGA